MSVSVVEWIAVALLGGVGALARFWLGGAVSRRTAGVFPLGTLVVNLSGTFVLGVLAGIAVGDTVALLAGTAFIGSFTTFSTWMLETARLAEDGKQRAALLNLGLSTVAGLALAALGIAIGSAL